MAEELGQPFEVAGVLLLVAIGLLAAVLVLLGVFPGLMAPLISSGAENVMAVLGGM